MNYIIGLAKKVGTVPKRIFFLAVLCCFAASLNNAYSQEKPHIEKSDSEKKHKGSTGIERNVMKGLRWLAEHQNEDGSWGSGEMTLPLTALGLLTLIEHGESLGSYEFGQPTQKALKYLISKVKENKDKALNGPFYSHALVSYSISEAYAFCKIPKLEPTMTACVKNIIDGINKRGCFNVNYDNSTETSDCMATAWNCLALASAWRTGCKVDGLEECIRKSAKGLLSLQNSNTHLFVESAKGMEKVSSDGNPATTWVALHALCAYGLAKLESVKKAYRALSKRDNFLSMNWNKDDAHYNIQPVHYSYHKTPTVFISCSGYGPVWKQWNKLCCEYMSKHQHEDGSWISPCENWNIEKKGFTENIKYFSSKLNLTIYSTALCCLTHEIHYAFSITIFRIPCLSEPAPIFDDDTPKESR